MLFPIESSQDIAAVQAKFESLIVFHDEDENINSNNNTKSNPSDTAVHIYERSLLTFKGLEPDQDVYNCSVPFIYKGKRYIYGRVERRTQWAASHVRLFVSESYRGGANNTTTSSNSNNNAAASNSGDASSSKNKSKDGKNTSNSAAASGGGGGGGEGEDERNGTAKNSSNDNNNNSRNNNSTNNNTNNNNNNKNNDSDVYCLDSDPLKDVFTAVPRMFWELEDPYVQKVHNEFILGGTTVRKDGGSVLSYFGFFFRGNPFRPRYFTTGPNFMKDIRTVQLADGRVGIFSRRRTPEEIYVGFTIIATLNDLTVEAIDTAVELPLVFASKAHWGGVNQPYLLSSGKIGCIAHYSYNIEHEVSAEGRPVAVYMVYAFVLDPETREVTHNKLLATRCCFPDYPCKKPHLRDCCFSTGIVMREDGKCDLYSGLGDTCEGRITIDYPFEENGKIVSDFEFQQ